MRKLAVSIVLLGGCIASEAAISRRGQLAGDAESGGIGFVATSTAYREDGVQNTSVGMSIQMLDHAPVDGLVTTLGADARYARQLTGSRRWRGFARGSFGIGSCQLHDCRDPDADRSKRYALGVALGVERMIWLPDLERPQDDGFFSASLAIVYTHSDHETLGGGDFLGLELGMRVGVNVVRGDRK